MRSKLNKNKILNFIFFVLTCFAFFCAGIYTANTDWFNDVFYIKSRQMENLNIKSLKPYNKALYKDAKTQFDMNIASTNRYEHYHKYYEKVTDKIRNLDIDEVSKKSIINYINGYEKRKKELEDIMFPKSSEENAYGTLLGSLYPKAMLAFDKQELLTYRMILENMYFVWEENINAIFEE